MRLLLIAVLCLAATAAQADAPWLTFSDPGNAFTVEFIGTPVAKRDSRIAEDGGEAVTLTYDLQRTNFELTAADTDLSRLGTVDGGLAVDHGAASIKGLLAEVSSDAIYTRDGQIGREVAGLDKNGHLFTERIFCVNKHLYQVITVTTKTPDAEAQDAVKHFQDSFHFTAH